MGETREGEGGAWRQAEKESSVQYRDFFNSMLELSTILDAFSFFTRVSNFKFS
jgi:hypothetical protein